FVLENDPRIAAAVRQTALRARDHFLAARKVRPKAALAALLPASLVPVYLKRLGRDVPVHRRQMALLAAAMQERLLLRPLSPRAPRGSPLLYFTSPWMMRR